MVFPERSLEYDLSYIIEKDVISFSRKYDLTPWVGNERWSFSKKYMEIYFLHTFWKDGLFRNLHWNMIFLVLSGKMVFFPRKHDIFSLGGKWRMIFFKKYVVTLRPTAKKNQTWPSPAKIHLKVIDALDWHSKESSNNYLCFCGGPYRRFHILLFSKENQEA